MFEYMLLKATDLWNHQLFQQPRVFKNLTSSGCDPLNHCLRCPAISGTPYFDVLTPVVIVFMGFGWVGWLVVYLVWVG